MKLLFITVSTDCTNPGFYIFVNSCNNHNIKFKNIGINKKWEGGDMENTTGGGFKINLLKQELLLWSKTELENTIILFTDSYDVINLTNIEEILLKYKKYPNGTILFSTEKHCWPNNSLSIFYDNAYYLNSGGYIGYAKDILSIINIDIPNDYDDQLYFTKMFLFNNNYNNIKLDTDNCIFQTFNSCEDDIIFIDNRIQNKITNNYPCLLHLNGPSKEKLSIIYELLKKTKNI